MVHTKYIIGLFSVLLSCFSFVSAIELPEPSGFVNDFADVFTTDEEGLLESLLSTFRQATSVEIAVVTLDSLEGDDIAFVATDIGQQRGVGDAEQDRGIVLLVVPSEREWFIAVGYGLEGTIPDAIATRIGSRYVSIYFPNEEYYQGVSSIVADLIKYIEQDPTVMETYQSEISEDDAGLWIFALVLGIGFLVSLFQQKKRTNTRKGLTLAGWVAVIVLLIFVGVFVAAAIMFASFVGFFFFPPRASYRGGRYIGGPWGGFSGGGSFGGGGFGGFGGGGFGGGGGGGGW